MRQIRGVIIVRMADAGTATSFLGKMGGEVHVRTVTLTKDDREVLGT